MPSCKGIILVVKYIYILFTTLACLSTYQLSYTKFKAALIAFVGLAVIDFAIRFKTKRLKLLGSFFLECSKYIWILVVVSLLIYVTNTSDKSLIVRGGTKIFYQILTIFIALCAVYEFEDKAVLYTFYGFAIFNFIALFLSLKDTGSISTAISDIIYFVTSMGDARGYMRRLELSESTFTFGLFILFFVVDGIKKNKLRLLICLFFFYTGFKRIGWFAMIVSVFLYLITRRLSDKHLKLIVKAILYGFIAFGFGYVIMVHSGLFVQLMNELKVDMMGRQNLYQYIEDFYTIDPLFMGHGFESIRTILAAAGDLKVNDTYISKLTALHNDYLAMYIQMGFFGFLAWEYYKFIDSPSFCWKYGRKAFMVMAMANIYMGMTYMTDNSAMYFLPTIVLWMLPMHFAISEGDKDVDIRGNSATGTLKQASPALELPIIKGVRLD